MSVETKKPKHTSAQINLAATIYGHALLAQMDDGINHHPAASLVRGRMRARSRAALWRLGIVAEGIQTEAEALAIAVLLKP